MLTANDAPAYGRHGDGGAVGWVEHAIWWHVYPLGFAGAPIRPEHPGDAPEQVPRLRRLLPWLDYAVDLGLNGLLLGPVFASASHGYDTLDYRRIDPRLGGDADFEDLVAACRERGLRLVLDGVFNHVGRDHPTLTRVLAEGPDSPDAELFAIDWDGADGPRPAVFEGHDALVELDHRSRRTAEEVTGVMRHWLDRGADGWRLDAAYAVDPSFWARVLPQVRETHPEAWFVGEVIQGDYPAFVTSSGVDSVTQYELWKAIWSSLVDANFFELDAALTRHNGFLDTFTPQTFVGNHDVTRLASRVGPERVPLAVAVLLTVGGIPSVYYGDDQGYTGIKEERVGGDDQVRPAFPERPDDLSTLGAAVHRAHRDLIGLRRRHPWLTTARTETLDLTNTRIVYRVHARDGQHRLDVELDATAPSATVRDGAEVLWQVP